MFIKLSGVARVFFADIRPLFVYLTAIIVMLAGIEYFYKIIAVYVGYLYIVKFQPPFIIIS